MRAVHGRPAAAHIVVVHAREIVVHERISVDDFHRRAECARIAGAARGAIGSDQQDRTQPLPFSELRVADGIGNRSVHRAQIGRGKRRECGVDLRYCVI